MVVAMAVYGGVFLGRKSGVELYVSGAVSVYVGVEGRGCGEEDFFGVESPGGGGGGAAAAPAASHQHNTPSKPPPGSSRYTAKTPTPPPFPVLCRGAMGRLS